MLTDNSCVVNEYVSVPREIRGFNPGAFVAGIIEGVVGGLGFEMRDADAVSVGGWVKRKGGGGGASGATGMASRGFVGGGQGGVSAHWVGEGGGAEAGGVEARKTVFLIRFGEEVVRREDGGR